ncbi:MAG: hypothetical protein ACRBB3_05155 [Alphaproteobacteria bacterium]
MIEAVSSSLASAQSLRSNVAEGVSSVSVEGARAAPQAPYISPHISIDLAHNKAVIEIRDSDTGDVQQQFPSESRLAQISQAQARLESERSVRDVDLPDAPSFSSDTSEGASGSLPSSTIKSSDIVTVQDITSSGSANTSLPSPQIATAALSATAQPQATASEVSVLA